MENNNLGFDPKFVDAIDNGIKPTDKVVTIEKILIPSFHVKDKSEIYMENFPNVISLTFRYIQTAQELKNVLINYEEVILVSQAVIMSTFEPIVYFAVKSKDMLLPTDTFLGCHKFYCCSLKTLDEAEVGPLNKFFAKKKKSFLTRLKELFISN